MNETGQPGGGEQDGLFPEEPYREHPEIDLEALRAKAAAGGLAAAAARQPDDEVSAHQQRLDEVALEQRGGTFHSDPEIDAMIKALKQAHEEQARNVKLGILSQDQADLNSAQVDRVIRDLLGLGDDTEVDREELRKRKLARDQVAESRGEEPAAASFPNRADTVEQARELIERLTRGAGSE